MSCCGSRPPQTKLQNKLSAAPGPGPPADRERAEKLAIAENLLRLAAGEARGPSGDARLAWRAAARIIAAALRAHA